MRIALLTPSHLNLFRIDTLDPILSDSRFNDPQGYYIVWERCCRNYAITNIYSENPDVSSRAAGQTFYLEFPPVVKNGQPFYNSSPRLFPPLNDYACPRKPYYVDFAGIDDDGDSLVYSLVTPLTTHSILALPPLQPDWVLLTVRCIQSCKRQRIRTRLTTVSSCAFLIFVMRHGLKRWIWYLMRSIGVLVACRSRCQPLMAQTARSLAICST